MKQRYADRPGGRKSQDRVLTGVSVPSRRARAILLALPALASLLASGVNAQDIRPSAHYPRLTIGEVEAAFTAPEGEAPRAVVPVFLSEAEGAVNFVRVVVFYDEDVLSYDKVSVSTPGWNISTLLGFRERAGGVLEGALVRDDVPPDAGTDELPLFEIAFRLDEASAPDLLHTTTPVSFTSSEPEPGDAKPNDQKSFVGLLRGDESTGTYLELATELEAGSVTVYYHDFLEVGSGEMTRRAQSFVVPLYATVISPGDLIAVGVDYDELILREVRPVTPPVRAGSVAAESDGSSASFSLDLEPGAVEGSLFRAHVADLVFDYRPGAGVEPDGMVSALSIVASPQKPQTAPEGEGASILHAVPGRITFVEPRFVRGNIDSSVRYPKDRVETLLYGPELHDVFLLLQGLYVKGESLPCREAADFNDSGNVEMTDVILLLEYLYRGGPPPSAPFPLPDVDPEDSPEDIGCEHPLPHFRLVPRE